MSAKLLHFGPSALVLALALLSCRPAEEELQTEAAPSEMAEAPDLNAIRAGINVTNQAAEESMAAGDILGFVQRVYTADATILPPGGPVIAGQEAIQEFWAGAADQMGMTGVELTTRQVVPLGPDLAYEIGEAHIQTEGGPAPASKYVVIWRLGDDGLWRWDVDIWNEMPEALPEG